jgi:hypothetical protein
MWEVFIPPPEMSWKIVGLHAIFMPEKVVPRKKNKSVFRIP